MLGTNYLELLLTRGYVDKVFFLSFVTNCVYFQVSIFLLFFLDYHFLFFCWFISFWVFIIFFHFIYFCKTLLTPCKWSLRCLITAQFSFESFFYFRFLLIFPPFLILLILITTYSGNNVKPALRYYRVWIRFVFTFPLLNNIAWNLVTQELIGIVRFTFMSKLQNFKKTLKIESN